MREEHMSTGRRSLRLGIHGERPHQRFCKRAEVFPTCFDIASDMALSGVIDLVFGELAMRLRGASTVLVVQLVDELLDGGTYT
jgi:hypothetical protein